MPTNPQPGEAIDPSAVQWDAASPDPASVQWNSEPAAAGAKVPLGEQIPEPASDDPQAGSVRDLLYPDVDFDSGLTFMDRAHLAQADNFNEKKRYLEKVYGKDKVAVEWGPEGEPMLTVKNKFGRKVAAQGGGAFSGFMADIAGSLPELGGMGAGATLGADAGAAAGPIGMGLGALGGAALGAMTGKSAEEGAKALDENYDQTTGELIGNIAGAGKAGVYGEAGGQLVGKGMSRLARGPIPRVVTQVDDDRAAVTDRMLSGGARPPAASTMPGAKRFQFMETLANKTVGPSRAQDAANAKYIETRMTDILRDSGVPEAQLSTTVKELGNADSRVSVEEAGQLAKRSAQAHKEMLEGNVQARLTDAQGVLDEQMTHLDAITRRYRTGDLGIDVASGIRQSRSDFGTAMSKVYGKVDQMVGDTPLVPTQLILREAGRISRLRPQSAQSGITREAAALPGAGPAPTPDDVALLREFGIELPPGGKISFTDAQRFRTLLRERADEGNLTRGVTAGDMSRLENAFNFAIQSAAKDPVAAPAVRMLNAADKLYAQGIKKFNDATVRQLVKDLQAGIQPNAETVAAKIVQPGNIERMRTVRGLIGRDAWARVAGADYNTMMKQATDDVTGMVDGARLMRQVRDRGDAMEMLYGPQAFDIEELAKTLAVRDGKLPLDALQPGRARHTLEMLKGAERAEDDFMKGNALSMITNPKGNPERAYRWLVRPDNTSTLREAINLVGENSPQAAGIRQAALKEILTQAKVAVGDGHSATALSDALRKYTPDQQKLLFPNGMADDLHLLGRETEFALKELGDESKASFAAGAVLASPFMVRIPIQVGMGVYQTILQNPSVIRYLSIGLRQPPGPARRAARDMIQNLVRFGAVAPDLGSDAGAPQAPTGGGDVVNNQGAGAAGEQLAQAG